MLISPFIFHFSTGFLAPTIYRRTGGRPNTVSQGIRFRLGTCPSSNIRSGENSSRRGEESESKIGALSGLYRPAQCGCPSFRFRLSKNTRMPAVQTEFNCSDFRLFVGLNLPHPGYDRFTPITATLPNMRVRVPGTLSTVSDLTEK